MSDNPFQDKENKPDNSMLSDALGKHYSIWEKIKNHLKSDHGDLTEEWKFYGQKYGWQMKTFLKKRNLFFFIPDEGSFKIVFVFGDKAVAVIEQSNLPEEIKETLRNAKKYAEGRGLPIEVKSPEQIETIRKLVEIKVRN